MAMNATRLGEVNRTGDAYTALFLQVFAGEVLTSFEQATKMLDKHTIRTISQGKSASFPIMGRTSAALHTVGSQITGSDIDGNEKVIAIDGLLLSSVFLANIDEAMNHYDVRGPYSAEMGRALALQFDKHVLQEGVIGSRATHLLTAATAPNKQTAITKDFDNATLATAAGYWAEACFTAAAQFDAESVPEGDRYLIVRPLDYYKLVQQTDAINRDWGGAGAYSDGKVFRVAGINIINGGPATSIFTTNVNSGSHQVDLTTCVGLFFTPSAIGTVKLLDLAMESEYLIDYQGTLMVGKYAMGHGWLRPEGLIECIVS